MKTSVLKTWTLKNIGSKPGKITSGVLSNKQNEETKKISSLNNKKN